LLFLLAAGCQFPQVKDAASLSGVVTSANGPEAGVWVIAETTGLPTRFARIVITDERGRYVIPDLPKARYDVWVRGYGLVDSPKVQAEPGATFDLKAVVAPGAAAAAEYYPPIYWYSMLRIPYVWVDWFNALGLGENVPIATGNMNEAYLALVEGKFVTLRVPYPQGFFAKWAEGRIDDPSAGWRGRGLWATYSTRAVFHSEGGTHNRPRVVKFQLRN
jgi:hypothetical protein